MKKQLIMSSIIIGIMTSCGNNATEETNHQENDQTTQTMEKKEYNLKEIATNGQNAFFKDYDEQAMRKYFKEDYIQHNPYTPTGLETVLSFLPGLKDANTTYKTHRLLQDGDLVVAHNSYDNAEAFGAKEMVSFDVYRIENGKIAEHWDAVTPKVDETASGRSQTEGPTDILDIDKTEENKTLISNFMKDIMMGENPSKITDYISSEQYDQHNTQVKDGLEGLNEAIKYLSSQNNMFKYNKVHRIIGEGNFVLTQSEGEWNDGKKYAFYDLYRIANAKIVEHWDVIQEVPSEVAHNNGMF